MNRLSVFDPMEEREHARAARTAEKLRKELAYHNRLYHQLDAPEITDEAYDALFRNLVEIEERFPDLRVPDSPTRRVGGAVLPYLETRPHRRRMYGLDNVFSAEEWKGFAQKAMRTLSGSVAEEMPAWWADPKLDGLACEITYENGMMVQALTRGDGEVGEVVTEAMRTVRNLPLYLKGKGPFPRLLEVRGEVLMFRKEFEELNERQMALGQKTFANPRNAAAGSLRQLDTSVTAERKLRFLAYSIGDLDAPDMDIWKTHEELMEVLSQYGFATAPEGRLCRDLPEAENYYHYLEASRDRLPFEIDGVVYKLNNQELQQALGFTARAPRFAVAWKFAARRAETRLRRIAVQVGRTGVLTPVAELDPVSLGGVMVARATLHNEDEIRRMDLRENDIVVIQRAGDVIPNVIGPVLEKRPEGLLPYAFPRTCPACGSPARRLEGEVAWRCVNVSCPAVIMRSITHFVSKAGLDVEGVGKKWVEILIESGRVKSPADLFTVTKQELVGYARMGEISAGNFVAALDGVRQSATLVRFIAALGIRQVGEQTARILAERFKDMDELGEATALDLQQLPDIGPEVARNIRAFFENSSNRILLERFREMGLWPCRKEEQNTRTEVAGKKILFTGTLSRPRDEYRRMAENLGANIASGVSKDLDYLIAGEKPGAKLEKARQLGVTVLDEAAFLALVQDGQRSQVSEENVATQDR